ncbi:MAG TPA: sodium:calcium antiporter [Dehalococcoidia bacterium]|nr:sodium:calcium antiporter [Dehalococcoidia bacterium]
MSRTPVVVGLTLVAALPGPILRITETHLGTVSDTALYGLTIVAAAFLLSWAAEAAEVDISQGLAVAFIALIAVLPEYAVDMTFAWKAGEDPEFAPYAVANMTGANRLLIGLGWPVIVAVFWFRTRLREIVLEGDHAVAIVALSVATLYSFTIPLTGSVGLYDTFFLTAIFIGYVYIIARAPAEEPELVGPARSIGSLPLRQRRSSIGALFVYSAIAILASAEPFAEGLVESGHVLGVDEFLLVQWVAPLASEAPEFLIAGILAFRGRGAVAIGVLLSSKVNQWTLLIGGLPVAFGLSGDTLGGLPLDDRQTLEVLLTAAQSAFAVALLVGLSLSTRQAALIFALFAVQFAIPTTAVRIVITAAYLVLTVGILFVKRADLPALWGSARDEYLQTGGAAEQHDGNAASGSG